MRLVVPPKITGRSLSMGESVTEFSEVLLPYFPPYFPTYFAPYFPPYFPP